MRCAKAYTDRQYTYVNHLAQTVQYTGSPDSGGEAGAWQVFCMSTKVSHRRYVIQSTAVDDMSHADTSPGLGWQADRQGRALEFSEKYQDSKEKAAADRTLASLLHGSRDIPCQALNVKRATATSFLWGWRTLLKVWPVNIL